MNQQETAQLLNQVRKLTSSPQIVSNPVAGFVAKQLSDSQVISFMIPDTAGVGSIDLLASPYSDSGTASVVQTWSSFQKTYSYTAANTKAARYWVRLNPKGTSGTAKLIGPQAAQ